MTEQEKRERAEFDAYLRALIAKGEITPEEAEHEYHDHYERYEHCNGWWR